MTTQFTPADARRIIYKSLMAGGAHSPERSEKASATIEALLSARNAEIERLRQRIAEPNPDAEAYRWLRDEIGKTMADPLRWDGDEAEEAILARYVQWLAAERASVRTEVLTEAADRLDDLLDESVAVAFLKYLAHSPEAHRG